MSNKACRITKQNKRFKLFKGVEGLMRSLRRLSKQIRLSVDSEDLKDAEKKRIMWLETYREIQQKGVTPFQIPYRMTVPFVK